uniref:COesterase domain-containing protein n=1 Tax=Heterorhabditis bacteriophora TaxID=37862 RepID=A0A1I7W713_HETBA
MSKFYFILFLYFLSLLWQLGLAESLGKAKTAVTGAIVIVKGYLPFGPFTK